MDHPQGAAAACVPVAALSVGRAPQIRYAGTDPGWVMEVPGGVQDVVSADRNARIEERAYHFWLEEGRPHGRHNEHWQRAERELIEEESGPRRAAMAASRDGAEAIGAPKDSVEKAASNRPENLKAKPRARTSRPTPPASGSRGSRRPAAAKAEGVTVSTE